MKPSELSDRELLIKALSNRPLPTSGQILAELRRRKLAELKAKEEHRGFFKRERQA